MSIAIFIGFVAFVLGLSTYLGRRAKDSAGYFAAHGQVGWFVNGMAFAGDYLSAASFLGICGMIAFYGYDGFLYSIGFLAGWVVALFVIAEPIKRLGKFTFADALAAKFDNSRGITFAAAISTLIVSVFYLIPQMVGAGALVKPLLGLKPLVWHDLDLIHAGGVVLVGGIVITIVTTAGMVSTTWVQFIKGSLLVVFCFGLVIAILNRGVVENVPKDLSSKSYGITTPDVPPFDGHSGQSLVLVRPKDAPPLRVGNVYRLPEGLDKQTRGPLNFVNAIGSSDLLVWSSRQGPGLLPHPSDVDLNVGWPTASNDQYWYLAGTTRGENKLLPGGYFKGIRSPHVLDRLDFASLMLALFCGTAALPHILIRYYTVKDASAARKSTVVGICAIGFFYILTLYIGLGAMVSGNLDPTDSNMSAPLLAKTFGELPFAIISAIAFTTVLGTVSGLILAAAGAVAHDLLKCVFGQKMSDASQVKVAKIAAVIVGLIAIVLGILFKGFNTTFLVGWAFNIAASANLPAIVMILFWRGTTKQGVISGILVGLITSLVWLSLTKEAMTNLYHMQGVTAGIVPMSQPALVTVPLSFLVVVVVSLLTKDRGDRRGFEVATV